eukprot:CAMPEP_0174287160 /NCGR_PEP_ID=MMETSP0809-20121228/14662_1 /TAXON_ID=73025 ORGANISM="Eutreptiella gymnastica-like, Strain CCMP1594" /NCGR_SAMPLE_ID=MMETSP0809 /ASSEMBLY_ACC=CAM_ASM_000658 /LENGTH=81 /DNA_ID=CAMNT_0015383553 /DNA_START=148 /DNA_END=394 /DNA_ORIENTATION=-
MQQVRPAQPHGSGGAAKLFWDEMTPSIGVRQDLSRDMAFIMQCPEITRGPGAGAGAGPQCVPIRDSSDEGIGDPLRHLMRA